LISEWIRLIELSVEDNRRTPNQKRPPPIRSLIYFFTHYPLQQKKGFNNVEAFFL